MKKDSFQDLTMAHHGQVTLSHCSEAYDTLSPTDEIKRFCDFVRAAKERYDGNERRLLELEQERTDLYHAIEMGESLTDRQKRKLFSSLRCVLQERRNCKNENELLEPLYRSLENLAFLSKVLGEVRTKKELIGNRLYTDRSGILEPLFSTSQPDEKKRDDHHADEETI